MADGSFIPKHGTRDLGTAQLDLTALRSSINSIAIVLNNKDSGSYPLTEFLCGQTYFPNPALTALSLTQSHMVRQVYRKVINFGALTNAVPKVAAHGIVFTNPSVNTFTRIYGTATDPVGCLALPLPYSTGVLATNIELSIDGTNVIITPGSNRTNFTRCVVVIEWINT